MDIYIFGLGVDVTNFYDNVLLYAKHRGWKTTCIEDRVRQRVQIIKINYGIKITLAVFLKDGLPSYDITSLEASINALSRKCKDDFHVHRSDINRDIIKNILYENHGIPKNQRLDFYINLENNNFNIRHIDDMKKLFNNFNDYFKPFEIVNSDDMLVSSRSIASGGSEVEILSKSIGLNPETPSFGFLSYFTSSSYLDKNKNKNKNKNNGYSCVCQ